MTFRKQELTGQVSSYLERNATKEVRSRVREITEEKGEERVSNVKRL